MADNDLGKRALTGSLQQSDRGVRTKAAVLNELIARTKVRPTTANFLRILLKNQRIVELPQINATLAQVLDQRSGVVGAQVLSARPVPDSTKASLEAKLGQMTGKKIRLSFDTDESLLGGIVTRIGSTIYDGSVRNQLRRLGDDRQPVAPRTMPTATAARPQRVSRVRGSRPWKVMTRNSNVDGVTRTAPVAVTSSCPRTSGRSS